jgi:hypothetical protein
MSTGLQYLDIGIVIAVFATIFWWMIFLSTWSSARRARELAVRKPAPPQVWGDHRRGVR